MRKLQKLNFFKTRDFKNIFYNLLSYLIVPVISIISTPIFIKNLGLKNYGYWILINSLIALLGVTNMGLGTAIINFGSRYLAKEEYYALNKVISITLGISMLLATAVTSFTFVIDKSSLSLVLGSSINQVDTNIIKFLGIIVGIKIITSVFASIILAYQRYDINSRVNMFANIGTVTLTTVLSGMGAHLNELVLCLIFVSIITCIIFYMITCKIHDNFRIIFLFDGKLTKDILKYGIYAWAQVIINAMYTQMDKVIINAFLGPSALGIYSTCMQLAIKIHEIPGSVASYLFAKFSYIYEKGNIDQLKKEYYKANIIVIMSTVLIGSTIFLFANSILSVWINSDFSRNNTLLLRTLVISVTCGAVFIVPFYIYNSIRKVRLNTIFNFMLSIASLSAAFVLIPRLGVIGSGYGRMVGLPIIILGVMYLENKLLNMQTTLKLSLILLTTVYLLMGAGIEMFGEIKQDSLKILTITSASYVIFFATILFAMYKLLNKSDKDVVNKTNAI
ncbi:oligosaccharide flippase family protein [Fictibacillus enclensis]|uniref:oligosaccharide flippase family protein n=1 Tax=Fictibacillus enclensis TaxID=1017270 RepID=UPI00138F9C1C|nr:oligosaccharide flippase family protein [Fictibacillus enclensis]